MTATTSPFVEPHAPAHSGTSTTPTAARDTTLAAKYIELWGIRWETYELLVEDVGEQHVFITFDQGRMVIMPPLQVHDLRKKIIGRFVEMYSFVMEVPIASYGSSTWRRADLQKGLEADECYYIQHEAQVRGKTEFDLTRDPAPDLAIEVEQTHHPLDRSSIYAALGVNEIWMHEGRRLEFLKRGDDQRYHPISASDAFPLLTPEIIERFLGMVPLKGEFATIREFHSWLMSLPRPPQ